MRMGNDTGGQSHRGMRLLLITIVLVAAVSGTASAQEGEIRDRFNDMADLIILLISAVAVPNGAYGLFEWMTAGADQEKNQKGKKRIRNTFIALGGAAVIKLAVNLFVNTLGIGGTGSSILLTVL